jgi:hypothetical protein
MTLIILCLSSFTNSEKELNKEIEKERKERRRLCIQALENWHKIN